MAGDDLSQGGTDRGKSSKEHSLDELAKLLAGGTITRGQALKVLGAALLGGTLSAFFPRLAQARHKHRHQHHKVPICYLKKGATTLEFGRNCCDKTFGPPCIHGSCKCPKGRICGVGIGSGGIACVDPLLIV